MEIREKEAINREVEEVSRINLGNKEASSRSLEEGDFLKEDMEEDKMWVEGGSRIKVVLMLIEVVLLASKDKEE